jgi:hypothetical protein
VSKSINDLEQITFDDIPQNPRESLTAKLHVNGNVKANSFIGNLNGSADLLDGYHAGNAPGNIPINNGKLNTALNADLLDGKHAGNADGNIPINNGTLNTNLNADLLDGKHALE